MDVFQTHLNDILIDLYWNILRVQEDFVRRVGSADVTMSEMHIIEAVGDSTLTIQPDGSRTHESNKGLTISDIAAKLSITLPSVTVAIKKLMEKNCVQKVRSENDGRRVYVTLTSIGMEIYERHHKFHKKMVEDVSRGLSTVEKDALLKGINGMNAFFKEKIIQESKK